MIALIPVGIRAKIADLGPSLIRTYVPAGVGAAIAWAATLGVDVSDSTRAALVAACSGVATAVYYSAVRLAERRWPRLGLLLGSTRQPVSLPSTSSRANVRG